MALNIIATSANFKDLLGPACALSLLHFSQQSLSLCFKREGDRWLWLHEGAL